MTVVVRGAAVAAMAVDAVGARAQAEGARARVVALIAMDVEVRGRAAVVRGAVRAGWEAEEARTVGRDGPVRRKEARVEAARAQEAGG